MSSTTHDPVPARPDATNVPRRNWLATLSPRNIGAVYVLVGLMIVFGAWIPDVFFRSSSFALILNSSSLTALAALALIIPLSAGVFDLSFAYTMSLSGVTVATALVSWQLPLVLALLLGLGAGIVVGLINSFVVVVMEIDSFIGTLATGSLVLAFITLVTNGANISGTELSGAFSTIYSFRIWILVLPVFYALAIAAALWLVLERTPTGRRLYAIGFNKEAARLANIPVRRLQAGSLLTSGFLAAVAGIVVASATGQGAVNGGTPYLLPAFAAAFVGATQFKRGRFNAWGTLVAVLMLGTGTTGLALAGAPLWAASMFTGVVLIAALSATGRLRKVRLGTRKRFTSPDQAKTDGNG